MPQTEESRIRGNSAEDGRRYRALVLSPRVLLLDEPFAGLDEESRNRTGFLLQRLKSEQVGVVVTSHELLPLAGIADEHFELRAGRLITPTRTVSRANAGRRSYNAEAHGHVAFFECLPRTFLHLEDRNLRQRT